MDFLWRKRKRSAFNAKKGVKPAKIMTRSVVSHAKIQNIQFKTEPVLTLLLLPHAQSSAPCAIAKVYAKSASKSLNFCQKYILKNQHVDADQATPLTMENVFVHKVRLKTKSLKSANVLRVL